MLKVCAIGELLIDFSQIQNNNAFSSYQALPGGAPCNFLAACVKNDCKCSFIGKVGNDDFGKMLINTVSDKGIDTDGIVVDDRYFTTLAFVSNDSNGERSFSFARKPGADTQLEENEIQYKLIDNCDIFHFGTLSMTDEPSYSATLSAIDYAKRNNKIITFDPNYRAPLWRNKQDAISAACKAFFFADIVKISEEEALFYFQSSPETSANILISEYGVKLVAVTLGSKGCYFKTEKYEGYVKGISNPDTVDTTGAGDIWFGYFISNLFKEINSCLTENNIVLSCKVANYAASLSTASYGGISSVPDKEKVVSYINNHENI